MTFLRRSPLRLLFALAPGACHPAHGAHHGAPHVVSVIGTGDFSAKPDVARITLGCESQSPNAGEATAATAAKMAAIVAALQQAGVPAKDMQTAQLSIYSEQPPPPPYPPAPVAPVASGKGAAVTTAAPPMPQTVYRATNTVLVTMRQVDRAGAVIGAAFAAGANQAGGIEFDVENHQPMEDQARAKAVADAGHRAQELSRLAGVKLGRVVSVLEGAPPDQVPGPMFAAKPASFRAEGGAAPVEGGEVKVTYVVRVVYALAD